MRWVTRIVLKDLKLGFAVSTVLGAFHQVPLTLARRLHADVMCAKPLSQLFALSV